MSRQRVVEGTQQRVNLAFAPNEDTAGTPPGSLLANLGRLRCGRTWPAEIERRVLPENCLLEVAEPAARLEPEFLDQQPTRLLVGL